MWLECRRRRVELGRLLATRGRPSSALGKEKSNIVTFDSTNAGDNNNKKPHALNVHQPKALF